MAAQETATPGGMKLRALREAMGKTQLWVELEANLGSGYLQRVESGRVAQPERPTVERVLAALGGRYTERRAILEAFGYTVATDMPDATDFAWAQAASTRELAEASFPAYVLDFTPRLVAWNRFLPRLLGVAPNDPVLRRLAEGSFLDAWFDPASPLTPLMAEPERFLPAMIRAWRHEMQPLGREPWYPALRDALLALPRFRHYWEQVVAERLPASAARALVPLRLNVPGVGLLQFRLSSEPFTRDARFRLIYYFPADPPTMAWCARRADPPAATP